MVVPIESCFNFFIWSILFQNWIGQIAVLPWWNKETKKNNHILIPSTTSLASLFTIEGCCPIIDFIHNKKQIQGCGIKSISKYYGIPPMINSSVARTGTRWTLLCPSNFIITVPAMTFPYNNIDTNNNNNHKYTSVRITSTVTQYNPIKLISSKYTLHTQPPWCTSVLSTSKRLTFSVIQN